MKQKKNWQDRKRDTKNMKKIKNEYIYLFINIEALNLY